MPRFVYLCDTHLGADPVGYHQQPAYPDRLRELLRRLDAWIATDGQIDFVLHGGDMVDRATAANILAAVEAFALCRPVFLCLGNHDLTTPEALAMWLSLAPQFLAGGPEFSVPQADDRVHVAACHWETRPYLWDQEQTAQFRPGQLAALEATMADGPGPQVFCTHCQVLGVPPEQTGLAEPLHPAPESFGREMAALVARHPNLRLVLGAHSHINTHVEQAGVHYITGSAFWETPFEFKLIELDDDRLRVQTVALARPEDQADYDWRKTWVQGCGATRAFEAPLHGNRA